MVRHLSVSGFKSIRQMDVPCKRVNVFIGAPNTGKSNILESVGILSAAGHFERGGGISRFVRMQSMNDVFYRKSPKNPVQIRFDISQQDIQGDAVLGVFRGGENYRVNLDIGNPPSHYSIALDGNGGPNPPQQPAFWPLKIFNFYRS